MRPSFKSLRSRVAGKAHGAADRAREVAAVGDVPAGERPTAPPAASRPGGRERASLRRQARRLRRMREAQLRDLALLVLELERRGRRNPELVTRKAAEIKTIDDEIRGIATALQLDQTIEQVVAAGIAGSCASCGALLATDDRFCSSCGTARSGSPDSSQLVAAKP
jgi:hypothetical protein